MIDWKLVLGAVGAVWAVTRVMAYFKKLADVHYQPGVRFPFSTLTLPGAMLPTSSWNGGLLLCWGFRHILYREQETVALVGWLAGPPVFYTSSIETMKQIFGSKTSWEKLSVSVESLAPFGENVFSTYWDRWPRHRRIVAPGFNPRLYASVWNESVRTYHNMLAAEGWADQKSFIMEDALEISSKIALFLIAGCGFGMPLEWNDNVGEKMKGMSIQECFGVVADSIIIRVLLPKWAFKLPIPRFRKVVDGHDVLESILRGIIAKRRQEGAATSSGSGSGEDGEVKDVFTLLLKANDEEKDSKLALSDQELVSNVFLLMLAGHETTSRGLVATIGLLACCPEQQERAYREIVGVCKEGEVPTFKDFDSFPFVLGCFYEGMRLYPSIHQVGRRATEDTSFMIRRQDGSKVEVPIKAGTICMADYIGMGYNSEYYPDPAAYTPARWLSLTIEPLPNFSFGPRICIGKKFALTEGVAILVLMLRDWKVEFIPGHEGETGEEWRRRVMDETCEAAVGFGPRGFPLRFVRR